MRHRSFLAASLSALLVLGGLADAGRRSGGGFGGSRSSSGSSSYRSSGTSTGSSSWSSAPSPSVSVPRSPLPPTPRADVRPPANTAPYRPPARPATPPTTRTPSSTQKQSVSPSVGTKANRAPAKAPNTAASTKASSKVVPPKPVTGGQISAWKKVTLPKGVPRKALTYSSSPSGAYRYQLAPGQFYPYPQSYYRQHHIGYDLLKYALIFTAVAGVADALDGPDVIVMPPAQATAQGATQTSTQTSAVSQTTSTGQELAGVTYDNAAVTTTAVQQQGPGLWLYVLIGLLAAAAGWFAFGRRRGAGKP